MLTAVPAEAEGIRQVTPLAGVNNRTNVDTLCRSRQSRIKTDPRVARRDRTLQMSCSKPQASGDWLSARCARRRSLVEATIGGWWRAAARRIGQGVSKNDGGGGSLHPARAARRSRPRTKAVIADVELGVIGVPRRLCRCSIASTAAWR